jgi:DNA-binding PadR family transcriptional regulator
MFARQIDLISDSRCADRYTLSKIQFTQQRAYTHFRGQRAVVQDLASVLLVLSKWGYDRFCEYQDALADLVTKLCKPINSKINAPITYTGRQIRGALKTLEDEGYLSIPRTVSREERLAKIYRFNPKFIALTAKTLKMCDTDLLRRKPAMSEITRFDKFSDPQNSVFNTNESRAIDLTTRDDLGNIPDGGDAQPKKVVYSRTKLKRDLTPVQRQIVHWLAGCAMVTGQNEAITLCGDFVARCGSDEQIGYWVSTWPELTNSERSFAIRQLIGVLRSHPTVTNIKPRQAMDVSAVLPTYASPEPVDESDPPPNLDRFRAALLTGASYAGPGQKFLLDFRAADDTTQELMLLDLQQKLKNGKFVD